MKGFKILLIVVIALLLFGIVFLIFVALTIDRKALKVIK